MSLEVIEELCIRRLTSAKNPLMSLDSLYRRVMEDLEPELRLGEAEFRDFVANHEQMALVEGMTGLPSAEVEEWAEAGMANGPRVILKSRIPSPTQLRDMMIGQLDTMLEALGKALQEAESQGDQNAHDSVLELLARTQQMRQKIGEVL